MNLQSAFLLLKNSPTPTKWSDWTIIEKMNHSILTAKCPCIEWARTTGQLEESNMSKAAMQWDWLEIDILTCVLQILASESPHRFSYMISTFVISHTSKQKSIQESHKLNLKRTCCRLVLKGDQVSYIIIFLKITGQIKGIDFRVGKFLPTVVCLGDFG